MAAYYNEIDAYAAEWLRNLIKAGHIADGEVDTRSIVDVSPDELREFTQCHFFAGIAGWSHALRLAGWEDERQIWTGSCPCQPFSVAGQGKGTDDPRHLWPHFFRLIRGCRPKVVMGEQVAGAAGYGWLDGVRSDLESESYAIEGVDIPACSANAPHIRQRLYWAAKDMGVANSAGWQERQSAAKGMGHGHTIVAGSGDSRISDMAVTDINEHDGARRDASIKSGDGKNDGISVGSGGDVCSELEDAKHKGRNAERLCGYGEAGKSMGEGKASSAVRSSEDGAQNMADSESIRRGRWTDNEDGWWRQLASPNSCEGSNMADSAGEGLEGSARASLQGSGNGSPSNSYWDNAIWLNGADGKTRRAQPDICLLAHGVPARVGKLRAYGNAIVPQIAAEVIKAFMEIL